jgi:hypothetical protein
VAQVQELALALDPLAEPWLWDQPHQLIVALQEPQVLQVLLALLLLVARQSSLTLSLSKASKVQRVALFSENVQPHKFQLIQG